MKDTLSATDAARRAQDVTAEHGPTFATQAGIELTDAPGPLWQLFALTQLLSARIRADAAVASARELFTLGCVTPAATRATSWQRRVDALGRGGYKRYDFSTSTRLGKNADMVRERWNDDLRALRDEAGADPRPIQKLLQEFDGIGPAGAGIFVREVQSTWALTEPFVDALVVKGAERAGLPTNASALAALVPQDEMAGLCAALVRAARSAKIATDVTY